MNLPVILILISLLEAGILVAATDDTHDTAGHAGNKPTSHANNNQGWMGKISGVFGTGVKAVKDTVNPWITQANSLYTTPYIRIMLVCNYEGDSHKEGVHKEESHKEEKKEAHVVLFHGELNDQPAWGLSGGFAPTGPDGKPVSNPVAQLIHNDSNGALELKHAENEQHALKDFSYTLTNKGLAVIPVGDQGTLTAEDFEQLAKSMSKNEKKTIRGIGVAKFENVISGKPLKLVLGYDWKGGDIKDIKNTEIQLAATMSWSVRGLNLNSGVQATVEKALHKQVGHDTEQHGTAKNTPIVQLVKAKSDH